jgi:hypothetical protein
VGEELNEQCLGAAERSKRERERHRGSETTTLLVASQYIVQSGVVSGCFFIFSVRESYPNYFACWLSIASVQNGKIKKLVSFLGFLISLS